jgi:hypothetical protein
VFAVIGILAEEKQLAYRQVTRHGWLDAYAQQFTPKKLVGQLGKNTCAVTRLAVISDCATMGVIAKRL